MKNYFSIIACFVLLFFPKLVLGQQIKHLDVNGGNQSGVVRTIKKDTLGYVWIGTSQGLNRYSGQKFKNYNQFLSNGVVDIISKRGILLVLSSKGELFQYQYEQDRFKNILNLKGQNFLCFELINEDTLLIGLQRGLLLYDFKSNKLSKVLYPKITFNRKIKVNNDQVYVASTKGINVFRFDKQSNHLEKQNSLLEKCQIFDFDFDSQNRIWAGTNKKGLFVVENNSKPNLIHTHIFKNSTVRVVTFDKNNNALIAPEGLGLFVVNPEFEFINKFRYNPNNFNSITQKSIYEIYVDESNVYWLGLREVGIDLIYPNDNPFTNISYIPFKKNSINDNNIRSIHFHDNGGVWFGTESGVSKLSSDGIWTNYSDNTSLKNKAVLTINQYGENLILGVYGKGLLQFDPISGKTQSFPLMGNDNTSKSIFATHFENSDVWIGGIDGPVKHYKNGALINSYNTGNARSIISNNEGLIYVGSVNGLTEINKISNRSRKLKSETFKNIDKIFSLLYDNYNKCIWIGNKRGLFKYNLDSEKFNLINEELNFETGTVFSIQKVSQNDLWLGTYSGLWKLDIAKGVIRKYDNADGLNIGTFGFGASSNSIDGKLAFGGPKGATLFDPKKLVFEKENLKIYVSDFLVNGVEPDSTMIAKNINYLDKIELNYDQNSLSFDFETPTMHGSKKQEFSWQLKGYDDRPIISKTAEMAVYSKLPPGTYFLETKVTNVEGVLSPEIFSLEIIIKKPFWLSHWAFLVYTILGFIFIYLFILIRKSRAEKKFNDNKIKFFTEVAHDIRTPVTLIQLLVSQLSDKNKYKNTIELIHRNTQNLNEYVTQLLDFQKADHGMLKLSVSKVDLKKIIHRIVAEVEPLILDKSIDISISIKTTYLWFD
jgi:ligand-binding sensor domain-containing protein